MDKHESNVHREAEDILRQAGEARREVGADALLVLGVCWCRQGRYHEPGSVCPHCRGTVRPHFPQPHPTEEA